MDLKDRLRSKRSKRFGNVENDGQPKFDEMNFSSSDSDFECVNGAKKVREKFSAQKLKRDNGCYVVDNDHIYTSARSSGVIENLLRKNEIAEENIKNLKRKRCLSKNAVMARLNRERKKKYVSSLETENERLLKENARMNKKMEDERKKMSVMKREIIYLKGLLANSKELELILRNLKEVTGLPVTSSFIPSIKTETEFLQKSATEDVKTPLEYHQKIKSVNFPILNKDINLGSCCSYSSCDDIPDLENSPVNTEGDSYDYEPNINEDFLDFSNQNLDLELEDCFNGRNLLKESNPEVGICLHVNKKMISVEVCSICNSKATSNSGDTSVLSLD